MIFINSPFTILDEAFRGLYPDKKYKACIEPNIKDDEGNRAFGFTQFNKGEIPVIAISAELSITDATEIFAHEPIDGLSIKQIRQQVIDYLQGKRTVNVDYRRIRADQRGREDDEPTGKETLEIVNVMKYFTVVKRHGFNTCILHQDMFYIAGIGGAECL